MVPAVQGVHSGVGEASVPPGENVPLAQGLHCAPPKPGAQIAAAHGGCRG